MRDIDRIDKFCTRFAEAWKKYPDFRFGQMMVCILSEMQSEGRDPFFPEDEEMIAYIEKYMNKMITPYNRRKYDIID